VTFAVRHARRDDAGQLAGLFAELGYPVGHDDVDRRLHALDQDPNAASLVATDGPSVVGALTLYLVPVLHEEGRWCRLTALIVSEQVRGQGVGRQLVQEAEALASANGCARVELTSAVTRGTSHGFYEALGYSRSAFHFLKRLP
jgi:predicted N-acetyltransferase YhbS